MKWIEGLLREVREGGRSELVRSKIVHLPSREGEVVLACEV